MKRTCAVAMVVAMMLGSSVVTAAAEERWEPSSVRFPSVSFVVACSLSHRSSDDPLLHPGHAGGSHQHDFFGNTSTSASSTPAMLMTASTTCNEPADRAAYWVPSLRSGEWGKTLRAYYSAGSIDPRRITPYPRGIGVIGSTSSGSVAFSCGLGVDASGWSLRPPTCSGSTSVRITFPQCWNGRTVGTSSVVAAVASSCPVGFTTPLPMLRIVVQTATKAPSLATSAGAPNRMHADFWNAWDQNALGDLVAVCIRGERTSNREIKRCRTAGTGPRAVGGPDVTESNF